MSGEARKKRGRSERESTGTNRTPNTSANTPVKKKRPTDDKEVDSYLKNFPTSPAGTVKTWKQCEETTERVRESLRKLVKDKSMTIEEKSRQAMQLISELKSDIRIKNIDMDLDWSEVDETLPKLERDLIFLKVIIENLNGNIHERIQKRTTRLQDISDRVKAMCRYSNKTEIKTYLTTARNQEDFNDDFNPEEVERAMAGVKIPSPCKDEKALNKAMNEEYIEPWWPAGEESQDLGEFAKFFNDLLKRATLVEPLKRNDRKEIKKDYRKKMKETALLIRNWSANKDIPVKPLYFPNELAGEKDGVQPILYSVLWALTTMDARKGEDIHRERVYPPLNRQDTKRQIDFEAGEPGVWSPMAPPITATQAPIEAKNIAREEQNAERMHGEGTKQGIGHSSKRVIVSFDLGNTGVDGSSTSILLTPAYMQAIKVSLKDTGSDEVRIETKFSEMFPLVSREAFFASAKVHKLSCNQGWVPKPAHDFASLGLSVAAFIAGESVPWPGFYERIKDLDDPRFAERRAIATKVVSNMDSAILESFNGKENQH